MQKIITDKEDARKAGLLTNGTHFVRTTDGLRMYLPTFRYDHPVDLDALVQYAPGENDALPTLNDLLKKGLVTEENDYREYEVFPEGFDDRFSAPPMTGARIRAIIDEFRKHGFNVTRDAIIHNYRAWYDDLKSEFRDEANGYHLFSPCGCNPLRLSATSLCEDLSWQDTYSA